MNSKRGIVLIPGGQMSDWIWKDFSPLIRNSQCMAISQRLKENTLATRQSATLDDCTSYITQQIDEYNFDKIVIIGHSIGGLLAALVAQRLKEKVEHVLYIASNLPGNSMNAIDSFPFLQKFMIKSFVRSQILKDVVHIGSKAKQFPAFFCNTSSPQVLEYVKSQSLRAEPDCLFSEKVRWDMSHEIPQTYIRLLKDKTIDKRIQSKMAENLRISHIIDIESDHMVMLSHSKLLFEKIRKIIKE